MKRHAILDEGENWVAGDEIPKSRNGSRLSRSDSRASGTGLNLAELDEQLERMKTVRMSLPDINQAMDTERGNL